MLRLLTISEEWKQINDTLLMNSSDLQKRHVATLQELSAVRRELSELKASHEKRLKSEQEAIALSEKQQNLISKTNRLFVEYSKEMKAEVRKAEINGWIKGIAGIAIGYGASKIFK